MTKPLKKLLEDDSVYERAEQTLTDMCHGKHRWRMSIPVDHGRDTDMLLSPAVHGAREMARRLRLLDEEIEHPGNQFVREFGGGYPKMILHARVRRILDGEEP